MTDEPMVERLTDEELAELEAIIRPAAEEAEHGTVGECWCETTLADIAPALLLALSQLREQEERADAAERERHDWWHNAQSQEYAFNEQRRVNAVLRESLAAAERTVREQREALERIANDQTEAWDDCPYCAEPVHDDDGEHADYCPFAIAAAALAPDTEREGT